MSRLDEFCHEAVTRQGEQQPCDKTAVAMRRDPEEGIPYPVCAYHSRGALMVPLTDWNLLAECVRRGLLKATLTDAPENTQP